MTKTYSANSLSASEKRAALAKQLTQGDVGNGEVIEKGEEVVILANGETVNASGHQQELERNFSLLNMCAVAIVIGNCWSISGATLVLSAYNGGAPGIIYEFMAAGLLYLCVTASLAELASAIPSSAGVYHWASITPGRGAVGRAIGFFAGHWNALAYTLGTASLVAVTSEGIVQMWAVTHADSGYVVERWHVFVVFLLITWCNITVLLFANRALPMLNNIFMALGYGGWLVLIVALAVLPSRGEAADGTPGKGYASSSFVWTEWQNNTGYASNGLVFVLGMLNGAFNIGVPDCSTHMSEEVPRPARNIPIAMGIQMAGNFVSTIAYLVVLLYGISDWDAVLSSSAAFPLTEIYSQASGGSAAGALGLTVVTMLPLLGSALGSTLTASRAFWTLARDGATPFSAVFGRVHPRRHTPVAAILFVGVFDTLMGFVYLGSDTAFQAMVGSFVVLVALSYLAALIPFLVRRKAGVKRGPFALPGALGVVITSISCAFLSVWVVFYCFPYAVPVEAATMNYSSVIAGGLTFLVGGWYLWVRKTYEGPPILEY
ncbi:hypothetical protein SLS62_002428 [Diatrype stigma]|uniref:Choline transport protein n=1 Tax=Diatrype stigma TaxID=117547 RepID=A0AAN9YS72_9PEZI